MARAAARIGSMLVVAAVALAPAPALGAAAARVKATGSVTGHLTAGSVATVDLSIEHSAGWQNVQSVQVALRLRGKPLDQMIFDSADLSFAIIGDGAPASLTTPETLRGPFFSVNTKNLGLNGRGNRLQLTIPIKFLADPPPGARLFYTFAANGVPAQGFKPLTPPVEAKSGFSWGTLAVAIAAALFAGGFLGNLVASNRRRQVRPSIYAAVSRRIEEERTRK
jgi:hypothetical protein